MSDTETEHAILWQLNDGGRAEAGFRGDTGDCVVRAIAIGAHMDYRTVYDELGARQRRYLATTRSKRHKYTKTGRARTGSPRDGHLLRGVPALPDRARLEVDADDGDRHRGDDARVARRAA